MVTVKAAHERQGENGSFWSLELMGDVELIQSLNTGRFYATARRCFISCTFDGETAQRLIGSKFKGSIVRQETDQYDFTVPETGEIIKLAHRWNYVPEEGNEVIASPKAYSPSASEREFA